MGFFDLNIPYHESDRNAVDKSSLKGRRLKIALKAMELGYTGVAYNRTLKGVMSESDRCSTPLFPLSKITPSSSAFFAAVKFHRELMNVAVSSPFRQYTRLTVSVDSASQVSALNAGNPIIRSYDIVAVRPMNQNAFDQACQTAEVNLIAIDFSEKLPFRLKQAVVKAAIQRGVYFEATYYGLLADVQTRRQIISNCKLLVDWTRGKNIIISSGAPSVTELRGPHDVANLFSLLGLNSERSKAAISKNCRCLLANALRKKQFYKEAVKVEKILSSQQSAFTDWLKWDPISSGEGDLLLDEMEKFFAVPCIRTEPVKAINFASSMNEPQAHGLLIKGCQHVKTSKDDVPQVRIGIPPLQEDVQIPSEYEALDTESSAVPTPPSYNGACFNREETVPISNDNVNDSKEQFQTLITDGCISAELSSPVDESKFSDITSEEYNVEREGSKCEGEGVLVDMEEEQKPKNGHNSVELSHDLLVEGRLDSETIVDATNYQGRVECRAGRGRRKRYSPHRPLLFQFKRLLNRKSCKNKFIGSEKCVSKT